MALLLVTMLLMTPALSSGVALAVTRQRQDNVACYGTKGRDKLLGTNDSNAMFAKGRGERGAAFLRERRKTLK